MGPTQLDEENNVDATAISRTVEQSERTEVNGEEVERKAGTVNDLLVATVLVKGSATKVTMIRKVGKGISWMERELNLGEETVEMWQIGGSMTVLPAIRRSKRSGRI
jgi:hypothetical protein